MLTTLWTAKSGLNANQDKLDVISNNIVNCNTTGYKKTTASFSDLMTSSLVEKGTPLNDQTATIGNGVRLTGYSTDNSQGSLTTTEKTTDIALDGQGYFRVIGSDGTSYYTRDGEFQLDSYGRLTDKQGNLLDINYEDGYTYANAGITSDNFAVNASGDITVMNADGTSSKIGTIPLYTAVGDNAFTSVGDNLFVANDGVTVYQTFDADMCQGYLEGSNVDLSVEMTDMIVAQRAFQISSKALTTADEMWGMINNLR